MSRGRVRPSVGDPPGDERRYPSTIGGACYLAVLVAVAVALAITMLGDWRVGIKVLAASLGAAAALRLVLRQRDAGMLAVRHRILDVVILGGLGTLLWVLAVTIPDQPL